jgi:hypothetical protein
MDPTCICSTLVCDIHEIWEDGEADRHIPFGQRNDMPKNGTSGPMQSVYPRIEDVVVIAAFLSHTLTAAELELCVFCLLVQISGKGETIRLIRIYPII